MKYISTKQYKNYLQNKINESITYDEHKSFSMILTYIIIGYLLIAVIPLLIVLIPVIITYFIVYVVKVKYRKNKNEKSNKKTTRCEFRTSRR